MENLFAYLQAYKSTQENRLGVWPPYEAFDQCDVFNSRGRREECSVPLVAFASHAQAFALYTAKQGDGRIFYDSSSDKDSLKTVNVPSSYQAENGTVNETDYEHVIVTVGAAR